MGNRNSTYQSAIEEQLRLDEIKDIERERQFQRIQKLEQQVKEKERYYRMKAVRDELFDRGQVKSDCKSQTSPDSIDLT